jgi:hypothetical protein
MPGAASVCISHSITAELSIVMVLPRGGTNAEPLRVGPDMERVRIEMCRADIDLGQLDMARVRHYRDLIRGGGTLAPIHLSADNVIMDGRHRIIGLAAEGAATVAAVRVDRAMRRRPTLARHGFGRLARPAAS